MNKRALNEQVTITAWLFRNRGGLSTFPRRMEFAGNTYTFTDGLQYNVKKGGALTRIFDMNDGSANYRLRCEDGQDNWTLVAITQNA